MIRTGMQHESVGEVTAREEEESVSLCSLAVEEMRFGIDTRRIREVLGRRALQRVPLAPAYIGGVVPYRGEVLTAVSFRALLGLKPYDGESSVLVLDDVTPDGCRDSFGLMVDSVGGVVTVSRSMLAANPTTLDERSRALFDGAYRMTEGLLIQLDPEMLRPARLGGSGLFKVAEMRCAR
jgi:purine-binding chemotaxis protein CheW